MSAYRRPCRTVRAGNILIGGDAPVSIQSMLNTDPHDAAASIAQAQALEAAGCEIIRATVPDTAAAATLTALRNSVACPIVADIHFDYRLALASVDAGADKIRINPGNIGGEDRVRAVVEKCRGAGVSIRIGVNGGSLERELWEKYGGPTAEAMVESARRHIQLLEREHFYDYVLSLKHSNVKTMLDAYRMAAEVFDCPLHLGVTEAGTARMGLVKSAIGIGSLLADGIGDTIRVSLTADPVTEIAAARDILKASGRGTQGVTVVSCPTCGRTRVNLISLAEQVEAVLADCPKRLTVAVMGCAVNGPGEAREADVGIACGDGVGLLFKKGEIVCKVPEAEILPTLLRFIEEL